MTGKEISSIQATEYLDSAFKLLTSVKDRLTNFEEELPFSEMNEVCQRTYQRAMGRLDMTMREVVLLHAAILTGVVGDDRKNK